MKIVRLEDAPLEDVKDRPRDGKFMRRRLLEGVPGTPDNFHLQMVRTYGDFFSPRHHHNFDQVRFQIEGTFSFDRNGTMTPGTISYFPEAASYGPQSSGEDSLTVVLQFGIDVQFDNVTIYAGTYGIRSRSTGPLQMTRDAINLTDTECEIIASFSAAQVGRAIWKVGRNSSHVVQTILSGPEKELFYTNEKMAV